MKIFNYSEKNEYKFAVPQQYEELMQQEQSDKKKQKKAKNSKKGDKKGGFDIMLPIKILAVIIFSVSVIILADKVLGYMKDIRYNDQKKSEVETDASSYELVADKRETPEYPTYEGATEHITTYPQVVSNDKLKQLALVYPDFRCWFYIEDTTISYPVVQSDIDSYYLRRNMDGETNLSGTLFFDSRNDREKFTGNNIIYGHAMQNGTMFGTLKNYAQKSYWQEHQHIYLYTEDTVYVWKIFAAYETTTANNYIKTLFTTKESYYNFITKCKADSAYDTGVTLSEDSVILTLSTCHYYNYNNGRFVVQAVLIGETPLE